MFEIIKNPPEVGAVRIFEQPDSWDSTIGPTIATTTQGIATILLPSGPLNMYGAQWHLLKHTLTNIGSISLGSSLQTELTRQLLLDKDKKHRSFSWKLLRIVKKRVPCHNVPGRHSHHYPTLLPECRKGHGKDMGRNPSESSTDGHQLARPERQGKNRTDSHPLLNRQLDSSHLSIRSEE